MKLTPAAPLNTVAAATAKARTLHPGAFCKVALDSPANARCQVLLEVEGHPTLLAGAGPNWLEALAAWYEWHESQGNAFKVLKLVFEPAPKPEAAPVPAAPPPPSRLILP